MPLRDVTPLQISQPAGVGFTLEGHLLTWQDWRLRTGLQPPRGPGAAPGCLPRRRKMALGGAPALVRRDGRALPGRQPGPLPADRVRHRRVGPGLHDHLAGPGLRLPGRDRLPGRGGARLPRRAPDHTERDLHPRGGQRDRLEARRRAGRRRGQAGPAAGGLLPRHRGQLRVPGVLAVLPGREHRVRGPRDRDPGHLARRRAGHPARTTGRWSTRARTRRSTSTSSSPGSTSTWTGPATRSTPRNPSPPRWATDDPYGLGLVVRNTPLRTEAEGKQDYDWARSAAGRW